MVRDPIGDFGNPDPLDHPPGRIEVIRWITGSIAAVQSSGSLFRESRFAVPGAVLPDAALAAMVRDLMPEIRLQLLLARELRRGVRHAQEEHDEPGPVLPRCGRGFVEARLGARKFGEV